MEYLDHEEQTSPVLVVLMLVLGLTAVFKNGFKHEIVYYAYFITVPAVLFSLWGASLSRPFFRPLNLPLLLFATLSGLSLLWTVDVNETLSELYKIIFYIFIYYLASTRLKPAHVRKLVIFALVLGTCIALIGLLLFLFVKTNRITSVFMNANPFGIYLAMLSLLGFGLFLGEKTSWWLGAAVVIITDAFVLTGSRGSFIAFACSFPFLIPAFIGRRGSWKRLLVLGGLIALTVFLLSIAAPWLQDLGWGAGTLDRLVVRDVSWGSTSVEGRLSFWQVALRMIQERPWTGFGLGTYHLVYNVFRNPDHYWSLYAHNHYLQTGAETGIFSLAAFFLFFFFFFLKALVDSCMAKEKSLYWGLTGAGAAFLLHLVVDFTWNMPAVTILFWAFLGCIIVLQEEGTVFYPGSTGKWKRILAGGILAVFLLGTVQQLAAFKIMQQGEKAQAAGRFSEAAARYGLACSIYPWRSEYWAKGGENLLVLSQTEKKSEYKESAIDFFRRAIRLSPYDYYNYQVLGRVLWQEGKDGAEENLKKAVTLGGFKQETFNDLGYFYLLQGRPGQAVPVFEQGIRKRPLAYRNAPTPQARYKVNQEGIKMHLGLAKAYEELGRKDAKVENLYRVLEIDRENQVALRKLEKCLEQN